MKIAIIHDWLVTYAGAERVLEQILEIYPEADLYSIVDFIPEGSRDFIMNKSVNASFIQRLPMAKTKYRSYLPLMPLAIEQFDLTSYDLVISSSAAISKSVITSPEQKHISYCHSPIRYAWDMQYQYLKESGLDGGIKGMFAKYMLHKIRNWDVGTSNRVDEFVANSEFISKRIWRVYRRESTVIYPPVNIDDFSLCVKKENYYLTASRLVPYKKIDLIVKAFSKMRDKKLVVIGDGPDMKKIKSNAAPNIEIIGYQSDVELLSYMQSAKGFVFAALEDFGIIPVEAQACGTPVIAYGKGGALETVIDGVTGVFFYEQTDASLIDAINKFEKIEFDPVKIRSNATRFSIDTFKQKFSSHIEHIVKL